MLFGQLRVHIAECLDVPRTNGYAARWVQKHEKVYGRTGVCKGQSQLILRLNADAFHGRCRCGAHGDGFRTSDVCRQCPKGRKRQVLLQAKKNPLPSRLLCLLPGSWVAGHSVSLGFATHSRTWSRVCSTCERSRGVTPDFDMLNRHRTNNGGEAGNGRRAAVDPNGGSWWSKSKGT